MNTPICGSETLAGAASFRNLLAADAVDIVMLDIAWCGGLSEARKIAALSEAYNKPLAPHDCTGPVALMAGLQLALHAPTAIFQEVVRATLSTWYRDLVTALPVLVNGMVQAPLGPGLGTALRSEVRRRADASIRELANHYTAADLARALREQSPPAPTLGVHGPGRRFAS